MSCEVYANGMSIACKAADGKSIADFPDVCFTPPLTPATPPGVPIPYPNTGMASDTTDGSKTVMISDQEVMLKNKSYFKQSTGDEAGNAPKKGVVTSKIKGKVNFCCWSMDVKFEGENVPRHLDLTGHNEASTDPPNAPPWVYTDTMAIQVGGTKDPCEKTRDKAEKKCNKHLEKNTYKGGKRKGQVNQAGLKRDMCSDPECNEAMTCVLVPFDAGCCDGKTPHHVIPAHCFMPPGEREAKGPRRYEGCESYDPEKAPCICAHGKDKSNKRKQHARIHKHFDFIEDEFKTADGAGTWSYNKAAEAGAQSVAKVMQCDEDCTRAQLNKYHEKEPVNISKGTQLRADSSGSSTPPPDLTIITPPGMPS